MTKKEKKKSNLTRTFLSLLVGLPTLLSILNKITSLIRFEMRLAGRSIVNIIILAILCALLLTSAWLCLLAMLFIYLTSLQWSIQFVLLILFALNLLLFLIVFRIITKHRQNLIFPETRDLLHDACKIYKEL